MSTRGWGLVHSLQQDQKDISTAPLLWGYRAGQANLHFTNSHTQYLYVSAYTTSISNVSKNWVPCCKWIKLLPPAGSLCKLLSAVAVPVASFASSFRFTESEANFVSSPSVFLGNGLSMRSSVMSSGRLNSDSVFGNGKPSDSFCYTRAKYLSSAHFAFNVSGSDTLTDLWNADPLQKTFWFSWSRIFKGRLPIHTSLPP